MKRGRDVMLTETAIKAATEPSTTPDIAPLAEKKHRAGPAVVGRVSGAGVSLIARPKPSHNLDNASNRNGMDYASHWHHPKNTPS
jgi:hypothetical protein